MGWEKTVLLERGTGEVESDSSPRGVEVAPAPVPSQGSGQGIPEARGCGVWQGVGSTLALKKPPRAVTSSAVVDLSRRLARKSHTDIPRLWHNKSCSDPTDSLDWAVRCQCFL